VNVFDSNGSPQRTSRKKKGIIFLRGRLLFFGSVEVCPQKGGKAVLKEGLSSYCRGGRKPKRTYSILQRKGGRESVLFFSGRRDNRSYGDDRGDLLNEFTLFM